MVVTASTLVAILVAGSLFYSLQRPALGGSMTPDHYPDDLRTSYSAVVEEIGEFADSQSVSGRQIVADADLQAMITQIQLDAAAGDYAQARTHLSQLRTALGEWKVQLSAAQTQGTTTATAGSPPPAAASLQLPIVLYHYTPGNFEQQLIHIRDRGYTVIDLDQALAGLAGQPLPPKPVVITFDDGFLNQQTAFNLLKKYQMKATFYVINGGQSSGWCIGADRRYGDPIQPGGGCGDTYMNWNQIRDLDRSGLITIGAHTVDHLNLASLDAQFQAREIAGSKFGIEQQLGHSIRHFAYPYGAYNGTTIRLVREAGFASAVTTLPGTYQPSGSEFTLRRIRDLLTLP